MFVVCKEWENQLKGNIIDVVNSILFLRVIAILGRSVAVR